MPQNGLQCLRHLLRWIDDVNLHRFMEELGLTRSSGKTIMTWRQSFECNDFFWMLVNSEEIHYDGVWEEYLPMIFGCFMHCILSSAGICVNPASTWEGMEGKHHIHLCYWHWHQDIRPPNQSVWLHYISIPINTLAMLLLSLPNLNGFADGNGILKATGIRFFLWHYKNTPQSSVPVKHLKINKCGGVRKLLNQNSVICLVCHWVKRLNTAPVKCMKGTLDHCMVIFR